jgi:hypothetical protein
MEGSRRFGYFGPFLLEFEVNLRRLRVVVSIVDPGRSIP